MDCFKENAIWWATPGSQIGDHIMKNVILADRDDAVENTSIDLVSLNQYVFAYGGQGSPVAVPKVCCPGFIQFIMERDNPSWLLKYSKIKSVSLQRTCIDMWCQNTEQAYKIIEATKDTCYYIYHHRDTIDCSPIFNIRGYVNVSTELWPISFGDATIRFAVPEARPHPYHHGYGSEFNMTGKCGDAIIPDSLCSLVIISKLYNEVPNNYILPYGYKCGKNITEDIQKKILDVLRE